MSDRIHIEHGKTRQDEIYEECTSKQRRPMKTYADKVFLLLAVLAFIGSAASSVTSSFSKAAGPLLLFGSSLSLASLQANQRMEILRKKGTKFRPLQVGLLTLFAILTALAFVLGVLAR